MENTFRENLKNGIQHETTVPKTPVRNGVTERMNRTLLGSVRAVLSNSKLPKRFWPEALSTATYLHNRSPTNSVQRKTPHEVWTGCKPIVSYFRVFGCNACAHIPKDARRKIYSKTKRSIFLGYGNGVKGYRLYDEEKHKVFYSRDVIFNETKSTRSDNLSTDKTESQLFVEIECLENEEGKGSEVTEQQRPSRGQKAPDRCGEWVYLAHEVDDPATVKEALSSTDKNEWMRAMENEINSRHKTDVWDLMNVTKQGWSSRT